jgi:hypothetical protein
MLEEVSRQSAILWMYFIITVVLVVIVGTYELSMATPISLTHATIDTNFVSKTLMKGSITHSAAIITLPPMAGIFPYTIDLTNSNDFNILNNGVNYGCTVEIDGMQITDEQNSMDVPYTVPTTENVMYAEFPLRSGKIYGVFFNDVEEISPGQPNRIDGIRTYSSTAKIIGPFNREINFAGGLQE